MHEEGAHERLAGVRVLIVEDVQVLRELFRWILEFEGATVVEAGTGREALDLAAGRTFDVVLTDLGLPDMPGETVIAGVRSASQGRTPVAVVSGEQRERLAHALEVGAERAFAKPVDADTLVGYVAGKRGAGVAPTPAPRPRAPLTVLIVEDDGAMRALLRAVLEREGHHVIERPDGADVPAVAELQHVEAVILDKEIPGRDGLDLLSLLRERLPALPVILVTAFGGPGTAAEAVRRGAFRYLDKPFRVSTLVELLATVPPPFPAGAPESPA